MLTRAFKEHQSKQTAAKDVQGNKWIYLLVIMGAVVRNVFHGQYLDV